MKMTLAIAIIFINGLVSSAFAQVMGGPGCPTMEQQQAAYNQSKANSIAVVNTASQQLQCYYSQLATYWNQLHKDNQQRQKDIQQVQKDAQQVSKDLQQIQTDRILAEKLKALEEVSDYDEVCKLIEIITPILPECPVKEELKKCKENRKKADHEQKENCPNLNGFSNAGYLSKRR